MLKPYIIEKGLIRVIGKSVCFGGSRAKAVVFPFDHECRIIPASRWVYIPVRYDYPEELEIYGLNDGYDFPNGNGANITLGVPII